MDRNKIYLGIAGGVLFLLIVISVFLNSYLQTRERAESEDTNPSEQSASDVSDPIAPEDYPVPLENAGQLQAESDRNFNILTLDRDLRYPWIDRLPLSGDTYFVYYDIAEEALIVRLYAPDTPELRTEIENELREISVPYRDLAVQWER